MTSICCTQKWSNAEILSEREAVILTCSLKVPKGSSTSVMQHFLCFTQKTLLSIKVCPLCRHSDDLCTTGETQKDIKYFLFFHQGILSSGSNFKRYTSTTLVFGINVPPWGQVIANDLMVAFHLLVGESGFPPGLWESSGICVLWRPPQVPCPPH